VGTINIGGFRNASVDQLGVETGVTTDRAKLKQLLFDMQKAIAAELPVHTLFYLDGIYAYRTGKHDGWIYQKGNGIVNKLSFVAPPRR
jgi:peptide/nickel transport system substrate-binding protein